MAGSQDGTILLWDVAAFGAAAMQVSLPDSPEILSAAFSPHDGGQSLAVCTVTGSVWVVDVGDIVRARHGHGALASAGIGSSGLANAGTPSRRAPIQLQGHSKRVAVVYFSRSGSHILTGSFDGSSRLWDWKTGNSTVLSDTTRDLAKVTVNMVAFALADTVVVASESFVRARTVPPVVTINVYDVGVKRGAGQQSPRLRLSHHSQPVYVLEQHPIDDKFVMSAGYDGKVCIWNVWSGELVHSVNVSRTPDGKIQPICDGHFTADGTAVVVADRIGRAVLLDLVSSHAGERTLTKTGHYKPIVGAMSKACEHPFRTQTS
jgi:WD40 repeat protein